ncbi:MAG TPA: flavodoxin family protein [Clostridiales bacterium]|nr:flavodoxin family protein [Clostridiales bacterium]
MKKILVLNFSPRKKGNATALTEAMAAEINASGGEAAVYTVADFTVNPCQACAACKKQDVPSCVQEDDFAALIPELDACDGMIFASPIYFGRITGTAKNFIDRLYCYFNPAIGPMFTKKEQKRLAVVMPFGGGDGAVYQKEAEWLGDCLEIIGVTEMKSLLQGNLNDLWTEKDPCRQALFTDAQALARWVAE